MRANLEIHGSEMDSEFENIINQTPNRTCGTLVAIPRSADNWIWKLEFPHCDAVFLSTCNLILEDHKTRQLVLCPLIKDSVINSEEGVFASFDISPLSRFTNSSSAVRWIVNLIVQNDSRYNRYRLAGTALSNSTKQTNHNNSVPCIKPKPWLLGSYSFDGMMMYAYWEQHNIHQDSLKVTTSRREAFPLNAILCQATKVRLRHNKIEMEILCPSISNIIWTGISFVYRHKLEDDKREIFISTAPKKTSRGWKMFISLDTHEPNFTALYWDIRAVFIDSEQNCWWAKILYPPKPASTLGLLYEYGIRRLFFADSAHIDTNNQLFIYKTADKCVAIVCQQASKYSGFFFRLKERFAYLCYFLLYQPLKAKGIILMYEKYCSVAEDNGYRFFQYCIENSIDKELDASVYYVIDKRAPDYNKLAPYGKHVIHFMSLRHMIYLLAARFMVASDSKAHAYAWRCKESLLFPRIKRRKKLAFLQHGVLALKVVDFFNKGTNTVDLFITSNHRERDIVSEELRYPAEDVILTGLARWDYLEDHSERIPSKRILMMPTWRNWLEEVDNETFLQSDYYRHYIELLNSDTLNSCLKRNDLYIDFYLHPKFREYVEDFTITTSRITLTNPADKPLNEAIMECKALITDYSSICWDAYYLNKPVFFYHFDVEQYQTAQGAYIDLNKDLFGDRAQCLDELVGLLDEYTQRHFTLKPQYREMQNDLFEYRDHCNCRRICNEIIKRGW